MTNFCNRSVCRYIEALCRYARNFVIVYSRSHIGIKAKVTVHMRLDDFSMEIQDQGESIFTFAAKSERHTHHVHG